MRWYQPIRLASTPPSYVIERVSDLTRASRTCQISPSNAKTILRHVIKQLNDHMDEEYITDLEAASRIVLDSPQRAKALIEVVVGKMISDKEVHMINKEKPWMKNWLK